MTPDGRCPHAGAMQEREHRRDIQGLRAVAVLTADPEGCLADPAATLSACDYVPTAWALCLDGRCPIVAGGAVTYHDVYHVSAAWSRTAAGPLGRLLRQALAGLGERRERPDQTTSEVRRTKWS
jgi:hypothetical protein